MFSPVLFIDDDVNLLKSFKRLMNDEFNVVTAQSPEMGLQIMEKQGPFAIIVSDMKMPGLSGVEVLNCAHKINPDTVRVLLTGFAEYQYAIDAVNIGKVNTFLTKPCDLDTISSVLRDGIRQYQLTLNEKNIIERTYIGMTETIYQILAMTNPVAHSKANRLKKYCRHIANEIQLDNKPTIEIAAVLSQLGCITISQDTLQRHEYGGILAEEELMKIKNNNLITQELLMNIPRFEKIIDIISLCNLPLSKFPQCEDDPEQRDTQLCGKIMQVANGLDRYITSGVSPEDAISLMKDDRLYHDETLIDSLKTYEFDRQMTKKYIRSDELSTRMILDSDIYSSTGALLIRRGKHVTYQILSSIRNYSKNVGINEPFAVLTPTDNYRDEN
jgi:ActR/RegA family two-component response regulator